jgi:hypothetical protein
MARQTTVHHIPKHAGWPNGENPQVREAYDRQAEQEQITRQEQRDQAAKGRRR